MVKTEDKSDRIRRLLVLALILIAIHSIGFGISLIVLPCSIIEIFGFSLQEKFFAVQGGVFHLIISYAYITAALDPENSEKMIILSVITKFTATIFLIGYFIFEKQIIMVFISGILDFLMGLAILVLFLLFRKYTASVEGTPRP